MSRGAGSSSKPSKAQKCAFFSTARYVKSAVVKEARYGAEAPRYLDRLIEHADVELMAVESRQAKLAAEALRRYRKGRHPAGLTYRDYFSCALAMVPDEPLLFTGNDISLTDVGVVVSP